MQNLIVYKHLWSIILQTPSNKVYVKANQSWHRAYNQTNKSSKNIYCVVLLDYVTKMRCATNRGMC